MGEVERGNMGIERNGGAAHSPQISRRVAPLSRDAAKALLHTRLARGFTMDCGGDGDRVGQARVAARRWVGRENFVAAASARSQDRSHVSRHFTQRHRTRSAKGGSRSCLLLRSSFGLVLLLLMLLSGLLVSFDEIEAAEVSCQKCRRSAKVWLGFRRLPR